MALLTSAGTIGIGGLAESAGVAVAAGGDTFVNNGNVVIAIYNDHAADPRTITIVSADPCDRGTTHSKTVTVTTKQTKFIAGFDVKRYNNTSNQVSLTYSDAGADLTVAVYQL